MSTDHLTRKIDLLTNQIKPVQAFERQTITFDFSLFTPAEQSQLQALLDQVGPKLHWIESGEHAGRLLLDCINDEELDQLQEWSDLHDALTAGDTDSAALARRHLAMTTQDLIQAFLALDLQRLPENAHISDEHVLYSLRPELYRDIVENHINCNRITSSIVEDMRRWIHFYDHLLPAQS